MLKFVFWGEFVAKNKYAIELKDISKSFGSVIANENVNLTVKKGEILSLLGENGSGKTSLMNVLAGIYKQDEGQVFVNDEEVVINSPEDSKSLGIGMVHQHFKLVEDFTAADNILVGSKTDDIILKKSRFKKIEDTAKKFGFEIDADKLVADMSVSEKQTVEILKVLYYGADVLILDEPTAVLTLQETKRLFSILRTMRDKGCAIIIITHKLNEVLEISDRVTILRKGKAVGDIKTKNTNTKELTELMVGRPVELEIERPVCSKENEKPLLTLNNVSIKNQDGLLAVDDVSFEIKPGEILGVAGISGSGQKEICESIAGLQKIETGSILYEGENIEDKTPREIINRGISMSFIPEDRLGMGLAASLSITDNMMLKNYRDTKGIFVDRRTARETANIVIDELDVVTPNTETPVRRLSGGNVQKILLGREMDAKPKVIVTAYPVRGLDINSSYTIYDILNREKKEGAGILFVGEDLDVMLELCDKILVLCHGKVTGIVKAEETNKEELGLLMTDAYNNNLKDKRNNKSSKDTNDSLINNETDSSLKEDSNNINIDTDLAFNKNPKKKRKKHKTPLFRVVKRDDLKVFKATLLYLVAIFISVAVGGIFVAFNNVNPVEYYKTVITGCFENKIYIAGFIRILIPLIITSLGISFAFKMKFWNIGANGQFTVGAICATIASLLMGNSLPIWLTIIIMVLAGAIGGGLYGLLPALFKVKFGTNETLLTLMLNYVAYYVVTYLKNLTFFRKISDTGEALRPDFKTLPQHGWMPTLKIGGVTFDISLIIALVLVIITFIYFKHSKQGYEVSVVGDSENTARYAGMSVSKIVMRTMFISAALAGIAGMFQVSGAATSHTLSEGITSDVGWTGIIVAWLAKLNSFAILIVSVLMAILKKGCAVAESTFNISSSTSSIIEGLILFTILAADFFIRYKVVFRSKKENIKKVNVHKQKEVA